MESITLNQLKPGVILAEDVISAQRMVIARNGTLVTPEHLRIFRAWGITDVCVFPESGPTPPHATVVADEALKQRKKLELDELFKLNDRNNLVIIELYRLALEKAVKNG